MSEAYVCKADWLTLCTQWNNPGAYLRWMRDDTPSRLAPGLKALVGVQQDPEWHPEGDAFQHTCATVDAMADILSREGITGDRRVLLLLTMICHDMGKAVSTVFNEEKQRWVSPGHDVTGVPIAEAFLKSIDCDPAASQVILKLVRHHMVHCRPANQITRKGVNKLMTNLKPASLDDLLLVMEADCRGRGSASSGLPASVTDVLVPLAREWCMSSLKTVPEQRSQRDQYDECQPQFQ